METLFAAAGKSTLSFLRQNPQHARKFALGLPFKLQLAVVRHFDDSELGRYLEFFDGISGIEKKADDSEFQSFLLDFLNRIDERGDEKLKQFCRCYRMAMQGGRYPHVEFVDGVAVTTLHWPTESLGLGQCVFPRNAFHCSNEKSIFQTKFHDKTDPGCPISLLPDSLDSLLPRHFDVTFVDLPSVLPSTLKFRPAFGKSSERDSTTRQKYFRRIANLFLKLDRGRFTEALVVCAELLESELFRLDDELPYRHLIWGCLAVCLSSFSLSGFCVESCLHQVEKRVHFLSEKFDLAFFRQQVFSNAGDFEREKEQFEFLFASLPKGSSFCSNSLEVHLKSQLAQMENWLCEMVVMKKNMIFERRTWTNDQIQARAELGREDISRLRRILHLVHSQAGWRNYASFEFYFVVLDFYFAVFDNCSVHDFCFEDASDRLGELRRRTNLNRLAILSDYLVTDEALAYRNEMDREKLRFEKLTHQKSSKLWAELCFSHLALLSLEDLHDEGIVQFCRSEALAFYGSLDGNYRTALLLDLVEADRRPTRNQRDFQFLKFVAEGSGGGGGGPAHSLHLDLPLLFHLEPRLKHFALAGKKTAHIYQNFY